MGLTSKSTGKQVILREFSAENAEEAIALAGSPNVGKSTVFNALTGMKQHTGNWTGKTVSAAVGKFRCGEKEFLLADVPGMYSLCSKSEEERIARDFILFGGCACTAVVCDAVCLERNLSLFFQIAEYVPNVAVCVNLADQAEKKGILYDEEKLAQMLGTDVVFCSAAKKKGLKRLVETISECARKKRKTPMVFEYPEAVEKALDILVPSLEKLENEYINPRFTALKMLCGEDELVSSVMNFAGVDFEQNDELKNALTEARRYLDENGIDAERAGDIAAESRLKKAEEICAECRISRGESYGKADRIADRILTGRFTAVPAMLIMLAVIFWITLKGADFLSDFLGDVLFSFEDGLYTFLLSAGMGRKICEMLIFGVYRTLVWVVSVMLPPMAIFFPLFTLLEDCGVLPRIAYNFDGCFSACRACGKQALTMCMGFGCNAAGAVGCRIIDSPRERISAVITSGFVPCSGKIPALAAIIAIFPIFGGGSAVSAVILAFLAVLGAAAALGTSFLLSKTLLKGEASSYVLEMPPYRCPKIGSVLVRSFLDRTVFVLGRAVVSAVPMGLLIWILANIGIDGRSLLSILTGFLDPFARLFGMDGVILTAFILGLPANETVIPIMIMAYMSGSSLTALSAGELGRLLQSCGWTHTTAVCTVLFALFHFPCAATIITVKKETSSGYYAFLSALLPTILGFALCFAVNSAVKIFF